MRGWGVWGRAHSAVGDTRVPGVGESVKMASWMSAGSIRAAAGVHVESRDEGGVCCVRGCGGL